MSNPERRSQFIVRPSGIREIKPAVEHTSPVKFMVFVDAENLLKSVKDLKSLNPEKSFSYNQLFSLINSNGADTMSINFYTNGVDLPERFLQFLLHRSVNIIVVPGKESTGGIKGGPVDTVIATDMMNQADRYEEAVLVSGDGDFGYTIEKLIEKGKKVTVISSWRHLGRELPASGAQMILLEDVIPMLTYAKKPKAINSAPQLRIVS